MPVDTPTTPSASARRDPAAPDGSRPPSRWRVYGPLGLSLLPLALLLQASFYGRHVRPSADEWCFIPAVRDDGIWGLVDKFYSLDNGRLGNGVLVGAYAKFPVAGHQWYGPVSGVLMLALLWALTVALLRASGTRAPRGVPLLVAGMVTAVFLFATTNTYKTFYWPAASVSHTLAPVLCAAVAIPLLRARGRRARIAALAVAAGAGVFMGTLSEEASVVSLVVLGTAVLFARLIFAERIVKTARIWSLTGMAGIAAGTLLLVTSPGSRNRRDRFDAESVSMLAPESLWGSLRGYVEILGTVFGTWQYLGAVAAGVLLGLLAREGAGRARSLFAPARELPLLGLGAAAFLVAGYLCTVITYPVFGDRVVTTERTWNDYLLMYVLLLVAAGAVLGRRLRDRGPVTAFAAAGGALLCALTVVGLMAPLAGLGDRMEVRAERWDRQDASLKEASARGEKVMPYTPTGVARMKEPFGRQGKLKWPAQCVADYYHLEKVTYAPPPEAR
ncbi:hypothetical protein GCM10010387_44890 [Streptomyces inusitatus]|uniref:Uncharacterized protein n=1 Tax=Streptomyces inusitatus TaxID=68221 RepID=A0A918QGY9_9ACTN|nr:DUF6056 family protein [Streptomyces inusitatus]GGZ45406.1 hypothetical protein GCM10010387_44890 [Streptomyces inusitatus]